MNPVSDLVQQAKIYGMELGYRQCFDDLMDAINGLLDEKAPVHAPSLVILLDQMDEQFKIRQLNSFALSEELAKIVNKADNEQSAA